MKWSMAVCKKSKFWGTLWSNRGRYCSRLGVMELESRSKHIMLRFRTYPPPTSCPFSQSLTSHLWDTKHATPRGSRIRCSSNSFLKITLRSSWECLMQVTSSSQRYPKDLTLKRYQRSFKEFWTSRKEYVATSPDACLLPKSRLMFRHRIHCEGAPAIWNDNIWDIF